jgi:hypothetical protein
VQTFIINIIIKVLTDPKAQAEIKKLLGELFNDLVTQKFMPLVPLAAASAAHAFAGLIPGVAPAIEDVVSVANTVRNDLNQAIPQINLGIPLIDDIINAWRPHP